MIENIKVFLIYASGTVFMFCLAFAFVFTNAYFEAEAYRRLTGKEVTVWDAMFLDLRIQEEVKSNERSNKMLRKLPMEKC